MIWQIVYSIVDIIQQEWYTCKDDPINSVSSCLSIHATIVLYCIAFLFIRRTWHVKMHPFTIAVIRISWEIQIGNAYSSENSEYLASTKALLYTVILPYLPWLNPFDPKLPSFMSDETDSQFHVAEVLTCLYYLLLGWQSWAMWMLGRAHYSACSLIQNSTTGVDTLGRSSFDTSTRWSLAGRAA